MTSKKALLRRSELAVPAANDHMFTRVAAYREGEQKGLGAVGVNGVLVDAAHVKMAQATLERAAMISESG